MYVTLHFGSWVFPLAYTLVVAGYAWYNDSHRDVLGSAIRWIFAIVSSLVFWLVWSLA